MPPAKKYPCILCTTEVGGKTGGVQCTYCDRWVHPKCANITKAHLELYKLPSCQYICDSCVKVSAKIKKEIQHLQVTTMEMRENIEANKQEIGAQKKRLDKVERKVEDLDPAKIIEQSRDSMLKELRERESRKENLIIYQVEEPEMDKGSDRKEHDTRKVIEIFEFLRCPLTSEGIKYIFRVGEKKDDRPDPRPIIVSLKDQGARKYILENTRKLATSQYQRISITPDLTPLQRKEEEQLRKEAATRNDSMNAEERLNFEWVLVGMKGQRTLIKRRRFQREGRQPRQDLDVGRGQREGNQRREPVPSREPPRGRETARQLAVAEGERERERVKRLVAEMQNRKEKGVEEEQEEQEDEQTETPSIIMEKEVEPSGTMDIEEETEDEENEEDQETEEYPGTEQTQERTEHRKTNKRNRTETSLSPPQTTNKKKT